MIAGKHDADGSSKVREESETHELNHHAKQELVGGRTSEITVSYGCDCCENEVKSTDVNLKNVGVDWFIFVSCCSYLISDKASNPSFSLANSNPHASHDMGDEDDSNLQFNEVNVLTDFLSGEAKTAHKNAFNNFIELKKEPVPMNESC